MCSVPTWRDQSDVPCLHLRPPPPPHLPALSLSAGRAQRSTHMECLPCPRATSGAASPHRFRRRRVATEAEEGGLYLHILIPVEWMNFPLEFMSCVSNTSAVASGISLSLSLSSRAPLSSGADELPHLLHVFCLEDERRRLRRPVVGGAESHYDRNGLSRTPVHRARVGRNGE